MIVDNECRKLLEAVVGRDITDSEWARARASIRTKLGRTGGPGVAMAAGPAASGSSVIVEVAAELKAAAG